MKIERNNNSEFEVEEIEYEEKIAQTYSKRYKKMRILVYLVCLLLAFMVWCYAHYLDDPIVQKEVSLIVYLNGGESGEEIIQSQNKILIYGEASALSGVDKIENTINRNKFSEYNSPITIEIDLPDYVHSHKEYVDVTLKYNFTE